MPKWETELRFCLTCGKRLSLQNSRDLQRKKYCGRICGGVRLRPPVQLALTPSELEVIDGALLGDGCISKKAYRAALRFIYRCADLDLTQFVYASLPNAHMREPYGYLNTDGFSTGTRWQAYCTYSACSQVFSDIRARWYPHGVKAVPADLVLTPLAALLWHLGDGGVGSNRVNLSTHGFSEHEVQTRLVPLVEQATGVQGGTAIYLDGGNPRLYLRPPCAHAWLTYIGNCPVSSKAHRWELASSFSPLRRLPVNEVHHAALGT